MKLYKSLLSLVLALSLTISLPYLCAANENQLTADTRAPNEPIVTVQLDNAISLSKTNLFLAPNQAYTIYATLIPGASMSGISWTSSNTSVATVSQSGKITAVSAGTTTIRADLTTPLINCINYATCTVTVTEIPNGTYFLKNKQNSDYARVKSGSMSAGQYAVQYDYDATNYEKWQFQLNNDTGYYSIKSKGSSTSYYLTVNNSSSTLNEYVVLGTSSTVDGAKWRVAKTTSGAFKLTPKTGENAGGTGIDYVLAVSTTGGTNNSKLIQGKYVHNTSYKDEWYILTMPTSGSEVAYEPSRWNYDAVMTNVNCYGYILNNQVYPSTNILWYKQQPGEAAGYTLLDVDDSIIIAYVDKDTQWLSFSFSPIDKYEVCPSGCYKVALVIDPLNDYHWYRQNPDGTWSHKRGTTQVSQVDASGHIIYAPDECNRNYDSYYCYSEFVGYYSISPLNNYYIPIE